MAKKYKVELNRSGVRELLKSPEMQSALSSLAHEHSGGWQTDVKMMGTRVIASIFSTDYEEVGRELDNHEIVGGL